jgi:hypothetical protein
MHGPIYRRITRQICQPQSRPAYIGGNVMRNKSGHAKTIRAAGKKDNKENDKQKKFDVKNKQNE